MFFSYGKNGGLGTQKWETPIGMITEGKENIRQFYSYGDMPPWGKGPVQGKIRNDPNYIPNEFPLIDKFETCQVTVHKPGQPDQHQQNQQQQHDQQQQQERSMEQQNDNHQQGNKLAKEVPDAGNIVFLGAVIAGLVFVILLLILLVRRGGKKKHKHWCIF